MPVRIKTSTAPGPLDWTSDCEATDFIFNEPNEGATTLKDTLDNTSAEDIYLYI